MSVEAMLAVQHLQVRTTHACFRVLMTIAEHTDKAGRNCWASIETIAAEAQTDAKTVWRSLTSLEGQGLIIGERGRGRGKTTSWSLNFPIQSLKKDGVGTGFLSSEGAEKDGVRPGITPDKHGMKPGIPDLKHGVAPGFDEEKDGVRPGIESVKHGLMPEKHGLMPEKHGVAPHKPVLNLSLTEGCVVKPPKSDDGILVAQAVAVWNEVCGDVLPKSQPRIPASRATQLRNRMAAEMDGSLGTWREFCLRVRAAPHLIGENNRGWRASLDWCLNPTNMAKVLEGNFDPAKASSGRQPGRSYAGCL